jgi:hypothetical protein
MKKKLTARLLAQPSAIPVLGAALKLSMKTIQLNVRAPRASQDKTVVATAVKNANRNATQRPPSIGGRKVALIVANAAHVVKISIMAMNLKLLTQCAITARLQE